jgi:hypothetical protein
MYPKFHPKRIYWGSQQHQLGIQQHLLGPQTTPIEPPNSTCWVLEQHLLGPPTTLVGASNKWKGSPQ